MTNLEIFVNEKLSLSKKNMSAKCITFKDVVDALIIYCEKHNNYDVAELFEYDGIPIPKVLLPEFKHFMGYIHKILYIDFEENDIMVGIFLNSRTNRYIRTLIRNEEELVYCLGGDDELLGYDMLDKLYLDLTANNN